jgi:DNA helicase-2/ATP-dependent DNA helicase PcrA
MEALRKLSCMKPFNREPVQKFLELIDTARNLSESMSISNLLEYLLQNSGLNELYRTDEEEERLENLNELIQSVKTFQEDHKEDEISLTTYLQEIALYTNLDYSKSKNHVKVMTIHQSKGLEFPYVFISGLSDGIMPNKRSVRERKKSGMEEERRLMYVAATRAQKRLFITESEGYSVQGGFNKVPSRFIREIKEGLFVTEGHMDEDLWNRAAMFSRSMDAECGLVTFERKGFCEGDEVTHEHFGGGIIRNIYDGGEYCEVEFWESGLRSLKADKLTKA